jgi:hypothetical protein
VTVNGVIAYVYYISPTQVSILPPLNSMQRAVVVQVTNNSASSQPFTVQEQPLSPSFFVFNGGPYVAATHLNGSLCAAPVSGACLVGPAALYPGSSVPAKPGEIVVLYANGFGSTSTPVVAGSETQSGNRYRQLDVFRSQRVLKSCFLCPGRVHLQRRISVHRLGGVEQQHVTVDRRGFLDRPGRVSLPAEPGDNQSLSL